MKKGSERPLWDLKKRDWKEKQWKQGFVKVSHLGAYHAIDVLNALDWFMEQITGKLDISPTWLLMLNDLQGTISRAQSELKEIPDLDQMSVLHPLEAECFDRCVEIMQKAIAKLELDPARTSGLQSEQRVPVPTSWDAPRFDLMRRPIDRQSAAEQSAPAEFHATARGQRSGATDVMGRPRQSRTTYDLRPLHASEPAKPNARAHQT